MANDPGEDEADSLDRSMANFHEPNDINCRNMVAVVSGRKRYSIAMAFVLVVVSIGYLLEQMYVADQERWETGQNRLEKESRRSDWQLYQTQVDACKRANTYRRVVYANTKQAMELYPADRASFARQLDELKATEHVRLDGSVACKAAIPPPPPP